MFKKSTPEKSGSKEDPKRARHVYSGDLIYWGGSGGGDV